MKKNIHKGVLYIDDEPNNLSAFKAAFRKDFCVYTAESAREARNILTENYQEAEKENNFFRDLKIKIIIADQKMPKMTGVAFFEEIKDDFPEPIRLLLTAYADIEVVKDAINIGKVYHYISKPWNLTALQSLLTEAYELYRQQELEQKTIARHKRLFEAWRPPPKQ